MPLCLAERVGHIASDQVEPVSRSAEERRLHIRTLKEFDSCVLELGSTASQVIIYNNII